jgi:hypothetical protein
MQLTQDLTDEELHEDEGTAGTSSPSIAGPKMAAAASAMASTGSHKKNITLTSGTGNAGDAGTAFIYATAADDGG